MQSNLFKLYKDQIFDPKEQSGISSNKSKDVEKSILFMWWCSRNECEVTAEFQPGLIVGSQEVLLLLLQALH